AFAACELDAGFEARRLMISLGLDEPELLHMRDERRHAVIAQSAGMEPRRYESRAERVHLHQRGEVAGVAEVISIFAAREARAGSRLDSDNAHFLAATQLCADERKRDAREVRSPARAADDDIRIVIGHLE